MAYGLDLVSGSVFALLALHWLGIRAAVAVAAVGGANTIVLWHHPYAWVILVTEALCVGLLRKYLRPRGELLPLSAADGIYWLGLGMPLVALFYGWPLAMNQGEVLLVALKQAINGVLNATLAGALVILVQSLRRRTLAMAFSEFLFETLILAILVPALSVGVWQNNRLTEAMERELANGLSLATRLATAHLEAMPKPPTLSEAQAELPLITAAVERLVPGTPGIRLRIEPAPCCLDHPQGQGPPLPRLPPGLEMQLAGSPGDSRMTRWRKGRYRMQTPLSLAGPPTELIADLPASQAVQTLQRVQLGVFLQLGAITLLGLVGAYWISRRVSRPLAILAEAAGQLPGRLEGSQVSLPMPASALRETVDLAAAFARMETVLRENFQALEHEQARYRLLVEFQTDLFLRLDRRGRFLYASPSYCRLFGRVEADLIGQRFLPLVRPEDQETARTAWDALFRPPHRSLMEERPLTRDGRRWIQWANSAVLDADGRVTAVVAVGRDITDLKETEEELRRSEARLARAQRAGRVGVWEFYAETRTIWFSTEALRLFELPLDQPLVDFQTAAAYVHPEDRARMEAIVADALASRCTYHIIHRLCFAHGRVKYVSVDGEPVDGPGPARLTGTIRDMTQGARAATSLAQSEARFRAVFEQAPLGMAIIGPDRRPRFVNPALEGLLGRDAATIKALRFDDFTHPEDVSTNVSLFEELLAGRRNSYRMTKRYLRPDGTLVWGDLSVTLLPDSLDGSRVPLALVQDITERRRAEDARAEAELALQRYSAKLEAFSRLTTRYQPPEQDLPELLSYGCRSIGVALAALAEIRGGRYRLLAAVGDVALGTGAEVPMREAEDGFPVGTPDPDPTCHIETGSETVPHPAFGADLRCLTRVRLTWTDAEGLVHAGVLDLADRHQCPELGQPERQLLQLVAQRISANLREQAVLNGLLQARQREVIGHLAGGVAHDFNNVLGVIGNNLQYLEQLLPCGDSGIEARDVLSETAAAIEQAKVVTSGLLSLGRGEEVRASPCNLSTLVETFAPVIRRLLPPGIDLVLDITPGIEALTNPALLQAALLNLALNSRDAMGASGRLTLRVAARPEPDTGQPDLGDTGTGRRAELCIQDTGAGMTEAVRARIFEPLFSTKARGRGTGLGLFMVREFALRSRGAIQVRSVPGEGTCFRLWLPLTGLADGSDHRTDAAGAGPNTSAAVQGPCPASGPLPAESGSRPVILLVDDDPGIRTALRPVLEGAGFRVQQAVDGSDALDRLAEEPDIALVLSDIAMPRVDGLALYGALCCDRPNLPVILMTGDPAAAQDAADLDPSAQVLRKPLDTSALVASIRGLLGRTEHVNPALQIETKG